MTLARINNGVLSDAAQVDQFVDLLTGVMTDQPVTLGNSTGNVLLTNGNQTVTGVKTHSVAPIFQAGFTVSAAALAAFGTGDALSLFVATTPQLEDVRAGTAAAPDTTTNPLTRLSRTINLASGAVTGDGGEQASTLLVMSSGTAANQVQPVAARFGAIVAAGSAADASAIYATGINNGNAGVAIGATIAARAVGAGTHPSPLQVTSGNLTGSDFTVNAAGFSGGGIWVVASGANKSPVGLEFGNPFNIQYRAAIHLNSQNGGPADLYSFLDDGSATTGIQMNGTHTAAMLLAASAGYSILGGTTQQTSGTVLEVQGPNSAADPLVNMGNTSFTQAYSLRVRNAAGGAIVAISGGTNNFVTGTIAGDAFFGTQSTNKFAHLGGTISLLRGGQNNTLTAYASTATPAGGSATAHLDFGTTPALGLYFGSGAPTVSAPKGSLYLRTDGTTTNDRAYINTNASTTWTALTTAA